MAMNNTKTNRLDWTRVLTDEARLTDVVVVDDLAAKYSLAPDSVCRAVSRLAKRGLLSRVSNGVYLNKLVRDASATDFLHVLNPNSYVSLESALNHWGLSTQSPVTLTCVTTGKPKEYRTPEFAIDRKSTRLNSSHGYRSYAVFCLKKKNKRNNSDVSKRSTRKSNN